MDDKNAGGQPVSNEKMRKLEDDLKTLEVEARKEIEEQKKEKEGLSSMQQYEEKVQKTKAPTAPERTQQQASEAAVEAPAPQESAPSMPASVNETQAHMPPPQPVESQEKKRGRGGSKVFLWMFIMIFVAAFFAGGGYYLGTKSVTTQATPTSQPTLAPVVPTPTTDPTVDWKVYEDSICNYSLKYPSGWVAEKNEAVGIENLSTIKSSNFLGDIVVPSTNVQEGNIIIVNCEQTQFTSNSSLLSSCTQDKANNPEKICSSTVFGNVELIQIEKEIYKAVKNGKLYTFEVPSESPETDQILSTFKFTEASPSASPTITPTSSATPTATPSQ